MTRARLVIIFVVLGSILQDYIVYVPKLCLVPRLALSIAT
jgi:hypothetical protein